MENTRCFNCQGLGHKSIQCEFAMMNFRCLRCGMTKAHRAECDSKWFDLDAKMPRELNTYAGTERHNRHEFDRQGQENANRLSGNSIPARDIRTSQSTPRVSVQRRLIRALEPTPAPTAANKKLSAEMSATAIENSGANSYALPGPVSNKFAANIPVATNARGTMMAETAAQMHRSTSGKDEPVYESTRNQLATMIDDNTRYLMHQRDLEDWYRRKIVSGPYDVRLEQYAFRSAMYDQELARLKREMNMAEETAVATSFEAPSIEEAAASRPRSSQPNTLNPTALIPRIKVNDMGRVAVFDRSEGVYELGEKTQNVGAGLRMVKHGLCIDLLGVPDEATTVLLDFGNNSAQLTIDAQFMIIGERHLVCESGLIELPGRQQRDTDWQLQFLGRSGAQGFEIRYKTMIFRVVLDGAGVRVVMQ